MPGAGWNDPQNRHAHCSAARHTGWKHRIVIGPEGTMQNIGYVFAFGATTARVAVDVVTGKVCVEALDHHIAAGPIVDARAISGRLKERRFRDQVLR